MVFQAGLAHFRIKVSIVIFSLLVKLVSLPGDTPSLEGGKEGGGEPDCLLSGSELQEGTGVSSQDGKLTFLYFLF